VEQELLTLLDHQVRKITPGFPTGTSGAGTTYPSGSPRSPQVFLLVLVEQKLLTLLDHQVRKITPGFPTGRRVSSSCSTSTSRKTWGDLIDPEV
jgi:hypothetical protein